MDYTIKQQCGKGIIQIKAFLNVDHSIQIFDMMSDRQARSAGRSCDTVASFLIKTYQILQHPEFQHMISWEKDGIGFVVKDVLAFTKQILPKYFRHGNFSSFVRQLNMYDFHKVKQQNDNLVFKNPLFRKGQQSQLKQIKRKASKKVFSHRRISHQRPNAENQKYFSTLKTLKKSVESQINQSSLTFEKSISFLKENNESNKNKKKMIENICFNNDSQAMLDSLFYLKQECYKYFHRLEDWLNQGLEGIAKKEAMVSSCVSQIRKNKQEVKQPRKVSQTLINLTNLTPATSKNVIAQEPSNNQSI